MKKHLLSGAGFILFFLITGAILQAQNTNPSIHSTQFKDPVSTKTEESPKGAVEDMSLRTPYSSTWRMKDGKTISRYSSTIINQQDGEGRFYSALITGPVSTWAGGSTPSCLYPEFHTDSILVTVPAGIRISFFTIDYAYVTNTSIPIPMSDGVFYLSTICGKTDTISCNENTPGICFINPGEDFSSLLTPCITPSCNSQSFWLYASLSRFHGGIACDTNYVWYTKANSSVPKYNFSAYVEGTPIITLTTHVTPDGGSCHGTAKATPAGGTAPYTYLWSPSNQTTDSIGGLCAGNYCCTVTDSKGCTDSICVSITNATGIRTLGNSPEIDVYPNPTNGQFNVVCHSERSEESPQTIQVYNVFGEKVYSTPSTLSPNGEGWVRVIDLSSQPNGIYLYRVISETGQLIGEGKIIIQK